MTVNTLEAVLTHYRRWWGSPSGHQDLVIGEASDVTVYEWDRSNQALWTYSTLGVSAQPLPKISPTHRVEMFLTAESRDLDGFSSVLARVAEVPFVLRAPVLQGETIDIRREVARGSEMHRLWVTATLGERDEFGLLDVNGIHVHFLMLVPIHESEHQCLRQHGDDELWARLADEDAPLTDFLRDPIPT